MNTHKKAWLAFDTATESASFALKVGDTFWTYEQKGVTTHAEKCLSIIQDLLHKASISLSELEGIIIGRGPGSFTGLRVACAVAKGLAFSDDIPLYPISNLMLLAWQAKQSYANHAVLSLIDARMKQVYWAYYPKNLEQVAEHVSCISDIKLSDKEPVVLAGFNIEAYLPLLPQEIRIETNLACAPDAKSMIQMVELGLVKSVQVDELEPIYVRDQVTHGS